MAEVKTILSSISRGLLFLFVNHTSIYENGNLYVFENLKVFGEISNK